MVGETWIARGAAAAAVAILAACAGTPKQTAAPTAGAAAPANGALTATETQAPNPAAVERASTRSCRERVSTGRLLPKRVCTTPREDRIEDEASRQQMNNAAYGVPITGGG